MNHSDQLLQTLTPAVMVPKFGAFEFLQTNGHRFLVAKDGLWLEAKRPWIHLCLPIARQEQVEMPFGKVEEHINMLTDPIPKRLLEDFLQIAQDHCPNEVAAWIVWDEDRRRYHLRQLENITASRDECSFHRPSLMDHEWLVMDLHSHAHDKAFFSEQDDVDDAYVLNYSGVFGNVEREKPTFRLRLCANGLFLPMDNYEVDQWLAEKVAA